MQGIALHFRQRASAARLSCFPACPQNAITDAKAWKVALLPEHRVRGQLVKVCGGPCLWHPLPLVFSFCLLCACSASCSLRAATRRAGGDAGGGLPLAQVHAGFLGAWLSEGFNKKVLAKLREIDAARAGTDPLRIWVTGGHLDAAPCCT